MRQQRFEQVQRPAWERLRLLLDALDGRGKLKTRDPALPLDELPALFRTVCGHYALARSRGYSPGLTAELHALLQHGYRHLYRRRRPWARLLLGFLARDFPATLRRHVGAFWLAAGLLFLPMLAMGLACYQDGELSYGLLGPGEVAKMESAYDPQGRGSPPGGTTPEGDDPQGRGSPPGGRMPGGDDPQGPGSPPGGTTPQGDDPQGPGSPPGGRMPEGGEPTSNTPGRNSAHRADSRFGMFGFYVMNNVGIGFRSFAGGIFFGVGSALILAVNGLIIGATAGHLTRLGFGSTFWPFVVGHGALELTAIAICGAAGLLLGQALLAPGRQTRLAALRAKAQSAIVLVLGAMAMLVLAAVIEAFWSPLPMVPTAVKVAFGALWWILVALYFTQAGRGQAAADGP